MFKKGDRVRVRPNRDQFPSPLDLPRLAINEIKTGTVTTNQSKPTGVSVRLDGQKYVFWLNPADLVKEE